MTHLQYTISDDFLPAVVCLDYSGLESEEVAQLNNWLVERSLSFVNASGFDPVGKARCDITGLNTTCHTVTFPINEE